MNRRFHRITAGVSFFMMAMTFAVALAGCQTAPPAPDPAVAPAPAPQKSAPKNNQFPEHQREH